MGSGSDTDRVANRIAIGALVVAIGGLVYQQIQISQIEKGLELANEALTVDRKSEGRRLLDEAFDVLTTSPGIQYELRHVGEQLPALIAPSDFLVQGCELSQVDRAALSRAGDLLASAIDADPTAPNGLDRLITIGVLLRDSSLLARVRPALKSADDIKRVEIFQAAVQSDIPQVEKLAADIARSPEVSVALRRAAAEALALAGLTDAALKQLSDMHAEHWQDPGLSYAYARLLARDPSNRASLEKALEIARSPFIYDVKRPHFQLLEHDVLVSLRRFPEAWKAIDALRERNLFLESVVPYPWSDSVLTRVNAAPQAELDGIDSTIAQCPSARSTLEAQRASLLMSLGKCEEALVAMSKTMAEEWQVDLYRAMAANPKDRVSLLQAMESALRSGTDGPSETHSSSGFLAYALWSQPDGNKRMRAKTLATGIRVQHDRLKNSSSEFANKLEAYPFLMMAGPAMSVDEALAALDELAAMPSSRKKRSMYAATLDTKLTQSSRQFLTEKSMCKS